MCLSESIYSFLGEVSVEKVLKVHLQNIVLFLFCKFAKPNIAEESQSEVLAIT